MTAPPPGWYLDRADPRYVRWWDGHRWGGHVRPGQQAQQTEQIQQIRQPHQQPPCAAPPGKPGPHAGNPRQRGDSGDASAIEAALNGTVDEDSARETARVRGQDPAGGAPAGRRTDRTLFTEPVLVVHQRAKPIEVTNEYAVHDRDGDPLGSVVQVGQNPATKALRALSKVDALLGVKLEIRDVAGNPALLLHRPPTLRKSTVHVRHPDGTPVGSIRMENALGKNRFAFEVDGQRIGGMRAENLRAWDVRLLDERNAEIGRITKTWQGLGKAAFTTADNYVVQLHRPLQDPLSSMVLASAFAVDTALSQRE